MSQGYGYTPPTLMEAMKLYNKAKTKAKEIDQLQYSLPADTVERKTVIPGNTENKFVRFERRRLFTPASITEIHTDDEDIKADHQKPTRHNSRHPKHRRRRRDTYHSREYGHRRDLYRGAERDRRDFYYEPDGYRRDYPVREWAVQPVHHVPYPVSYMPTGGFYPGFLPNMFPGPFYQPFPYPNYNTLPPQQHPAAPPTPHSSRRVPSKEPARPYSDSDVNRYSIVPPIPQQNSRVNTQFRVTLARDLLDRVVDEALVEEILPDILIEVLLYGVKTIRLSGPHERLTQEYGDALIDEAILLILRETVQHVLNEYLAVFRGNRRRGEVTAQLEFVIDELIGLTIRDTVTGYCREYAEGVMFCTHTYKELVGEMVHDLIAEELGQPRHKEVPRNVPRDEPRNLDDHVLGAVLSRGLVETRDPIADAVIANTIAKQLRGVPG